MDTARSGPWGVAPASRPARTMGLDELEDFGRTRLSRYFFMRDMLHSEAAALAGLANVPSDPELAIFTGRKLATLILDPLVETFGPIAVRSAYRSPAVNAAAARASKAKSNDNARAHHIWDQRDANGHAGATACIVIPWFADRYTEGRDWRDLGWWLHDRPAADLPFSHVRIFPKLAAMNIAWHETLGRRIVGPPNGNFLLPKGTAPPPEPERRTRYADFPPFRGLTLP